MALRVNLAAVLAAVEHAESQNLEWEVETKEQGEGLHFTALQKPRPLGVVMLLWLCRNM